MTSITRVAYISRYVASIPIVRCHVRNGLERCYATLAVKDCQRIDVVKKQPTSAVSACKVTPPLPFLPNIQPVRCTSFFNKLSADQLWKGVTSVSNAGKKSGRGKGMGKKRAKNLNRGQVIGIGRENMIWPGLNAPILRGKELVQQQHLPKDTEREARLLKMRDSMSSFRVLKLDPLDRGWSGKSLPGRSIGPPEPIGEETFEGFDTRVLESKRVSTMTAVYGRKQRLSVFAVTGNGNGLGGFALTKSSTIPSALRKVKNKAGQRLMYIERYNNHTVYHDFYSQFGASKVFVTKKEEGYGLVCHRAIRTICEVIGIKDLHVKVEGASSNVQNITKAFFLGLLKQKTHQQLAEEKKLHLVEFRRENSQFPKVVASPSGEVRSLDEISKDEQLDYNLYTMDGKVRLREKKYPPGYERLPSYNVYLKKFAKFRNHAKTRFDIMIEHGELRSFYTDMYPECVPRRFFSKSELQSEEE